MTYQCPFCRIDFDATAVRRPSGISGPSYCPNCEGRVRVVLPHGKYVVIVALLIAFAALVVLHIKTILGFAIGIPLIWLPLSMYLNALSFRYKPPVLRKWEPSDEHHYRSLFEWLYERNRAPEIFDDKKKEP
jgi:hypothetical protein